MRPRACSAEHALGLIKGVFYSAVILFLLIYARRSAMLLAVSGADGVEIASMPTSILAIGFLLNCALVIGWRFLIRERRPPATGGFLLLCGEKARPDIARFFSPAVSVLCLPDTGDGEACRSRLAHAFGESSVKPAAMVVDATSLPMSAVCEAVSFADSRGVQVRLVNGYLELLLARSHPRLVSYVPLVDLEGGQAGELYDICKRLIDILLGITGLTLTPFLLGILLLNRRRKGRLRLAAVERVYSGGQIGRILRLRHAAGLPNGWVRAARLCLIAWHLARGDLTLVGLPPISRRYYESMGTVARRFLRERPGIFYLSCLRAAEGDIFDKRAAAIVYYSRHRGLALDLQIFLNSLRAVRRQKKSAAETPSTAPRK